MKTLKLLETVLNLFDGAAAGGNAGGDAGAGAGADSAQAGSQADPGSSRRGRKAGGLSTVQYGKQAEAQGAEAVDNVEGSDAGGKEPDVQVTSDTLEERRAKYRDLTNGELKEIHEKEIQRILNKRLRNVKSAQEALTAQQPIIESLLMRYGIPDGDVSKLAQAIDQDEAYWTQSAEQAGMSVPQYKEYMKLQRENEAFKRSQMAQQSEQAAQQKYQEWIQQADEMRQVYPDFDLQAETENPQFMAMLKTGIPVKHAYEVVHLDDIKTSVARNTAQKTEKTVVDSIRTKGTRPTENGVNSPSGVIVKSDPSKLTKEDRAEIARRVSRGEQISF